ncbi:hypothetical protein TNCV_1591051 [Trichonephila clavipes]|nr:hypothetical protein TNCV_1591051 [Trichonephila clavipes]
MMSSESLRDQIRRNRLVRSSYRTGHLPTCIQDWRKRRECDTFKVVKSLRNVTFRDRCIYQRVLKAPQYTSTELQQHIQNILDTLKQTRAIIIQLQASSFHLQLPLTGCH